MSIRLFSSILVILFFSGFSINLKAQSQTAALKSASEQTFVLIPTSSCNEIAFKDACKASKLANDFEGRTLKIHGTDRALAIMTTSNGPSDEHAELTCYRCALGKFRSASECGPRYAKIFGKAIHAKDCPNLPN